MTPEDRSRDTYLRDIAHVLFKRKTFIIVVFLLVVAGVTVGLLASSREYEATATIMLTRSRSEQVLTPNQGQDGSLSFRVNPIQELNAETQLLVRRPLLDYVVRSIGSDSVLAGVLPPGMVAAGNGNPASNGYAANGNGYAASDGNTNGNGILATSAYAATDGNTNGNGILATSAYAATGGNTNGNGHVATNGEVNGNGNGRTVVSYVRDAAAAVTPTFTMPAQRVAAFINPKAPIPQSELAILSLKQGLRITPLENANLIKISFPADDPKFAGKVLTLLLDQYLDEYPRLRNTPGAAEFFERQMNRYAQDLRDTEEAKLRFETTSGSNRGSTHPDLYLQAAIERETELQRTRTQVEELGERARMLKEQVASMPEKVRTGDEIRPNPVMDTMRTKLLEFEIERGKLLQRYTEQDRRVQDIEREIALLRARLASESPVEFARESYGQNSARTTVMLDLINTEAGYRQATVKAQALEREAQVYAERLDQVTRAAYDRARMERKLKLSEESYLLYARKFEEARISSAMDKSQIVNVALVEPVHVAAKPGVGGKGGLTWLTLATAIGMVAGVGGAFCRDFFDQSLSTDASVKRRLGLPVLGSLPEQRK